MVDLTLLQTAFNERSSSRYALLLWKAVAERVQDVMTRFPEHEQEKMAAAITAGVAMIEESVDILRAAMVIRESDWEAARLTLQQTAKANASYKDIHSLIETLVSTGLEP